MTTIFTLIDDTYSSNESSGRKRIFGSVSCVNPYTAGGELLTVSSYFKAKSLGGQVVAVHPSVAIAGAGVAATGKFRGDTSSYTTIALQFFNAGLSATANAGLFVDTTVANMSNTTVMVMLEGY
jgi:hypothetical protein